MDVRLPGCLASAEISLAAEVALDPLRLFVSELSVSNICQFASRSALLVESLYRWSQMIRGVTVGVSTELA